MNAGPKCWTTGHQGAKKWQRAVPHSVPGPLSLACMTAVEDTEVLFMFINRFLESFCSRICQHSELTGIVL